MTWEEFFEILIPIQDKITPDDIVFGVPKGGMIVSNFLECKKTHDPSEATVIVDDIVDSGRTKKLHEENFPKARFIPVIDKQNSKKYEALNRIVKSNTITNQKIIDKKELNAMEAKRAIEEEKKKDEI